MILIRAKIWVDVDRIGVIVAMVAFYLLNREGKVLGNTEMERGVIFMVVVLSRLS